jgi:hypothetical protein
MGANQNECYSIHFIPEENAETFLLERVGHFVCMLAIVHFGTTGAIFSSAWVCATQYLGVGEVGSVDWCFVVVCGDGCEPVFSCKRHMERHGLPLNLHFTINAHHDDFDRMMTTRPPNGGPSAQQVVDNSYNDSETRQRSKRSIGVL